MAFLALLFAIAAGAAHYFAGSVAAAGMDDAVRSRRWETQPFYAPQALVDWVRDSRPAAMEYANILYPYDLVFALCFGAALALACYGFARALGWSNTTKAAVLLLPIVFVLADFTEDVSLLAIFAAPDPPAVSTAQALQALCVFKLAVFLLAFLQAMALFFVWAFRKMRPT